jgi:hypothetical protein
MSVVRAMAERNTTSDWHSTELFQTHNMSQIDYKLLTRAAHPRLKFWQRSHHVRLLFRGRRAVKNLS